MKHVVQAGNDIVYRKSSFTATRVPAYQPKWRSTKQKHATRIVARTGAITWSEPGNVQKLGSDERGAKEERIRVSNASKAEQNMPGASTLAD
jgi:hypothetical protein